MTLKNVFSWLDKNILMVCAGVLFVVIPLFPKIPLADLLPGYIVRLRIEDMIIAISAGIWFLMLLRKKVEWNSPITKIITAYLVVGLLSSLSAIFWVKSVPMSTIHIQKVFLHYVRRIEYFSLFFVVLGAIKNKSDIKKLLIIFLSSSTVAFLYGLGQKYLYWPVYSTMNREFSKGLRLYLTEHARVQSTFGGHYDFAAFLVIALPILLALSIILKKKWLKVSLFASFVVGLWGLMMTSSRSSFLAYFLAVVIVLVYLTLRRGLVWGLSRGIGIGILTFSFLFMFGDLSQRFGQIFKDNSAYLALEQSIDSARNRVQLPIGLPPKEGISIDDVNKAVEEAAKKDAVIDKTDTMPSVVVGGNGSTTLPPDVFVDIPIAQYATKSAEGKDIEVVIPRVFSENAHRLGLSAAIRLDTLWPFAIRGFLRNPLLGSGYSTLTKYTKDEFTEAESTDNDFLRTLGETGLLGFLTFYGSMLVGVRFMLKTAHAHDDSVFKALSATWLAVTLGLFVNAIYIDVFVSSKIAQTYWMMTGLLIAYALILKQPDKVAPVKVVIKSLPKPKKKITSKKKNMFRSA